MSGLIKEFCRRTDSLYNAMTAAIGQAPGHEGDARSAHGAALAAIAIEHGFSIRALVEMNQVTSAIVLLRAQFEAVLRGIWIWHAAPDDWVRVLDESVEDGALEEPNAPDVKKMLAAMENVEPKVIGRQLSQLKDGAWKPLNSYVHGGIHPVTQFHRGYAPEYAIQTVRNANGLAGMASTLLAVMSNDPKVVDAILQAQLDHLDCMPPLARPAKAL